MELSVSTYDINYQPRPSFLSSVRIDQSYMTCLNPVTPRLANASFRRDVHLESVRCICYSSNLSFGHVNLIDSRCMIKIKHALLLCSIAPIAKKSSRAEALVSCIFPRKFQQINRAVRQILLHSLCFDSFCINSKYTRSYFMFLHICESLSLNPWWGNYNSNELFCKNRFVFAYKGVSQRGCWCLRENDLALLLCKRTYQYICTSNNWSKLVASIFLFT